MASTIFTNQQTVIQASWLNDVNAATYTTLPAVVIQSANNNTTLNNIESFNGSSLVGYNKGGANAITTNVESKLRETISVKDFGAKGDGTTDDTAAIQNAINAAQGKTILLPAGTYLITSSLQLNWSTAVSPIYQPATRLIGDNCENTIILNRSGGYALIHTPTVAQTTQSIGVRMTDGELAHFKITTDGSSPAGSAGIKLASYFNANIHDLDIEASKSHGIYIFLDSATYGSNTDKYSCGTLIFKNNIINGSFGWGIRADTYSITWLISNCTISNNSSGGIYTCGAGHNISDNGIVGNGNVSQTSVGGVVFSSSSGTQPSPENIMFRSNELQDNWGSHIYHEGFCSWFIQNRYLQDATAGTGGNTFRNNYCIYFDASQSGGCNNNIVSDSLYRFDNATNQSITCNYVADYSNAYNNVFSENSFSPSSFAATITKYGFPSSSAATNRSRNYAIEYGIQIAGGSQTAYSYGQIVTVYNGTTTSFNSTPTLIPLTSSYNPNIANNFTFVDATHRFVTPYNGLLRVAFNGVFQPLSGGNGVPTNIYVYKNGSVYHTQTIPQGFVTVGSNQNYSFEIAFTVAQNDYIQIYASVSAGNMYAIGNTTSTTTFQML